MTNDITEMRDAIGDILYVVYGAGQSFGFPVDTDFATIHSSNMSKLCTSEEEAQQTVTKYENDFKEKKSTGGKGGSGQKYSVSLWR